MKAYKGFNKNMTCRGFQFEEGKSYELPEGQTAEACERGFHACENPVDCFRFYPPATSVFHEVEQSGDLSRRDEDSKVASSRIRIGARLDVAGIIRASVEYVRKKIAAAQDKEEGGDCASLAGGDSASLAGGDCASLAGGARASLAGGYSASLAGGVAASLAGGYSANLAGGDRASLAGGDWASLAGGYSASLAGGVAASLAGGDWAIAASRGTASVGKDGVAVARGNGCRVKGGLGSILVVVEESAENSSIKEWKAFRVDGKRYKPDTWYCLRGGKVVEATEGGAE